MVSPGVKHKHVAKGRKQKLTRADSKLEEAKYQQEVLQQMKKQAEFASHVLERERAVKLAQEIRALERRSTEMCDVSQLPPYFRATAHIPTPLDTATASTAFNSVKAASTFINTGKHPPPVTVFQHSGLQADRHARQHFPTLATHEEHVPSGQQDHSRHYNVGDGVAAAVVEHKGRSHVFTSQPAKVFDLNQIPGFGGSMHQVQPLPMAELKSPASMHHRAGQPQPTQATQRNGSVTTQQTNSRPFAHLPSSPFHGHDDASAAPRTPGLNDTFPDSPGFYPGMVFSVPSQQPDKSESAQQENAGRVQYCGESPLTSHATATRSGVRSGRNGGLAAAGSKRASTKDQGSQQKAGPKPPARGDVKTNNVKANNNQLRKPVKGAKQASGHHDAAEPPGSQIAEEEAVAIVDSRHIQNLLQPLTGVHAGSGNLLTNPETTSAAVHSVSHPYRRGQSTSHMVLSPVVESPGGGDVQQQQRQQPTSYQSSSGPFLHPAQSQDQPQHSHLPNQSQHPVSQQQQQHGHGHHQAHQQHGGVQNFDPTPSRLTDPDSIEERKRAYRAELEEQIRQKKEREAVEKRRRQEYDMMFEQQFQNQQHPQVQHSASLGNRPQLSIQLPEESPIAFPSAAHNPAANFPPPSQQYPGGHYQQPQQHAQPQFAPYQQHNQHQQQNGHYHQGQTMSPSGGPVDALTSPGHPLSTSPGGVHSPGGGRHFMAALSQLRAGPSDEQRAHADAQRAALKRDLEEQIREKKDREAKQKAQEQQQRMKEDMEYQRHLEQQTMEQHMASQHSQHSQHNTTPPEHAQHTHGQPSPPPSQVQAPGRRVSQVSVGNPHFEAPHALRRPKKIMDAPWLDAINMPDAGLNQADFIQRRQNSSDGAAQQQANNVRRSQSWQPGDSPYAGNTRASVARDTALQHAQQQEQKIGVTPDVPVGLAGVLQQIQEEQARLREEVSRQVASLRILASNAEAVTADRHRAWQEVDRVKSSVTLHGPARSTHVRSSIGAAGNTRSSMALPGDTVFVDADGSTQYLTGGGDQFGLSATFGRRAEFVVSTHLLPRDTNTIPDRLTTPLEAEWAADREPLIIDKSITSKQGMPTWQTEQSRFYTSAVDVEENDHHDVSRHHSDQGGLSPGAVSFPSVQKYRYQDTDQAQHTQHTLRASRSDGGGGSYLQEEPAGRLPSLHGHYNALPPSRIPAAPGAIEQAWPARKGPGNSRGAAVPASRYGSFFNLGAQTGRGSQQAGNAALPSIRQGAVGGVSRNNNNTSNQRAKPNLRRPPPSPAILMADHLPSPDRKVRRAKAQSALPHPTARTRN